MLYSSKKAEGLAWYDGGATKREEIADDVRAREGDSLFKFGESLRIARVSHQRADKEFALSIKATPTPDGFRLAPDGVL